MREPISSFGTPWDGETWSCSQCGETGPDRDDHRIGSCPARPRGMHDITYSPPEHEARVRAPFYRTVKRERPLNIRCDICREPLPREYRYYAPTRADEPSFVCLSHPVREGYLERPARKAGA